MSPRAVREYVDALRPRYGLAKKPTKTRLLDEAERVTGYNRKALVRLLNRRLSAPRPRRGRPRRYGKPIERAWGGSVRQRRLGR